MILSGVIKAVRKQGLASLGSLLCLFLVSLPMGYLFGVTLGWGLSGFWAGWGVSNCLLSGIYLTIISKLNWIDVAEIASRDEFKEEDSDDDMDEYTLV